MDNKPKNGEKQDLVLLRSDAENLIAKAIDRNVSVETMEKLLAMRRELQAEWAKRRFDEAMANFQAECPIIKKTKKVDFTSKRTNTRVTYSFAPLEKIIEQVKEPLAENGFSYTIQTLNEEARIVSIVNVRHIDGHAETTQFAVPIDKEAYMNAQQQYGAASTFSKRYAFCNAFGILTGDEDTDADDVSSAHDAPAPKIQHIGNGSANKPAYQTSNGSATFAQVSFIEKLLQRKGHTEEEIFVRFHVTDLNQLTVSQASTIIDRLKELPEADREGELTDDGYRVMS